MQVLATIAPLDVGSGSRVTLRASSADSRSMLSLNSVRWVPAITRRPSISDDLFDGNFTGVINDGGATIDLAMFGLKRQDANAATYRYAGAAVTIYHGNIGDAWPWTVAFTGIVDTFTNDAERLSLRLKVNTAPFGVPALTATYAGTGGKEGGADLKFKVKPWAFGALSNIEPVLIDATNNVYQVSGYGPINGVTACYERAASFGASYGNYTTYALLVAASIPPGRWATCLAEGMIRLGAPAAGLITADVEGDKPSTFLRKTGEIINRICTNAGIASGSIDSTSLNGLDTALTTLLTGDGYINLYLTEQTTVMEIAQRLARPCNAAAGVHPRTGKLYVCRTAAIGTSVLTLNAQGRKTPTDPGVLACVEQDVSPPYWRIEMQGQRSWRVHSASEIAFTADLVEVGDYAGGTTYREGNIATNQGGRWLYINPTATAGNAPPTLPTTSNSYWSSLTLPVDYSAVAGTKPPSNADNTAVNTPDLTGNLAWDIAGDVAGTVTTVLPADRRFKAFSGTTDVSTTTGFVLSSISPAIALTVNNTVSHADRGVVTLGSGTTGSGTAKLTATLPSGAVVERTITVTKTNATATVSGGAGATIGQDFTFATVTSGTHAAISDELQVRSDGSNHVRIALSGAFVPISGTANANIATKFSYSTTPGGAPTDLVSEVSANASVYYSGDLSRDDGSFNHAEATFTMPAANTDYYFIAKARRITGSVNISFTDANFTVRQ